jgi:hypothetical protein
MNSIKVGLYKRLASLRAPLRRDSGPKALCLDAACAFKQRKGFRLSASPGAKQPLCCGLKRHLP